MIQALASILSADDFEFIQTLRIFTPYIVVLREHRIVRRNQKGVR